MADTDTDLADRLTKRRARISAVMAAFFMLSMVSSLNQQVGRPETFRLAAWTVWALVLLMFLVTGGNFWRGRNIRALLDDETTQAHRQRAFATGFWVMVVVAFTLYIVSFYDAFGAREAVRMMLTSGIVAALLRFSFLERRSLA